MSFDVRKCVDRDSLPNEYIFAKAVLIYQSKTNSFFTLDSERRQEGEKKRAVSKKNEEVRR